MIAAWLLPLLALGYVGLLFAVAYKGDRRGQAASAGRLQPFIYALSLGVYCTSWTFYGAVGTAATGGFAFLPIYLGPILVFTVGFDFLQRVVRISKARNATSIADLLALRYGKSRAVAVLVTLLAVAGGVPYIALQLKAVTVSMEVLGAAPVTSEPFVALLVAGGLALFAILFGTRELDATEHHRGMMWAIALESVVKLVAFVAIGIFALATLGGLAKTGEVIAESQDLTRRMALLPLPDGFITSTLLAMAAIICLPRQFHVAAVEYRDRRDLRTARWLFPLYLVIFSMFVIPIAVAGLSVLPENVSPDTFVLALPAAGDHQVLSLLAFIGGFSAATSMVIVATVALATMVSNDIVLPVLLRRRTRERADVAGPLLQARRAVIVLIALASWGYFLIGGTSAALASIGLLAFAAVAQFAPALVLGVYWSGATRNGALAGLIGGGVVWLYALLLPVLVGADSRFVVDGLLGISWLRPQALFGFDGLSPLSHGALWSLGLNIVLIVLVSRLGGQSLGERMEALAFTDRAQLSQARAATQAPATLSDLQELAARFVGRSHARTAFAEHADEIGWGGDAEATANAQSLQFTERLLSGSIGAASARSVLSGALQRVGVGTVDAARLLNATSQVVRFNRQLLESTLNSISQAVSVVDENLDLVGWNQAYVDLFDYPTGMVHLGQPIDVLLEENGRRGLLGEGDTDALISLRLKAMDRGEAHTEQRVWPDGRVIEVQGRPMPGGGYVTTYTDVTPYKRAEEAVRASEEQVRLYTDNAPAMLTYIDADRRLRFANRAYLEFVGSDRDAVLGQQLDDVLSPGEFLKRREYIDGALSGDRQEFEIEVESADGVTSYALGTYLPDRDPVSGSVRGVFAVLQDITSRRRAEVALQEVNETLEQRVVQRTGELQEAKAEAEEANRAKSRFLAAASHDLLQPLNAARLFASVLSQHTTEMEARHAELVSRVDSSLTAAEELLSALLDISKLDRGVLRPAEEVFAVAELLERLSTQFAPLMRENGLEFRVRPTDAVIRSDRQMLRRIVQNFLANAFRYTPSGGILLGCRVRGDCLRIAVWDTGPGISDDERERIFDEFHREDRDHVRGQQGLGLGLAIARRMAATLGLEIGLASRPAHGSCFWVDVPLAEATVVTAAPVAGSPERPTGDFDGLRVLCVENDESIQEGMLALLERWGCDARAAADVTGCHTAMADGFRPEVILLDFHLDHGWSGLDVLDALGSKVERVPTVLITADRSEELQAEAVRRGIRMLRKPLRPAKLRRLLTGISRPEIAES